MPDFTPDAPGLDRRQLLVGSAIAVPAIMLTTAVPAHATSADSALSVDIAASTVAAGGSSSVTATVLNSQGLGWAGQTVTLAVTGPSGATLASSTGTTDSAGHFTTTLNVDSLTANGATVTVTATSGPLTATDTTTITGGVTLTVSTAADITAGSGNTVTATLKNASNVGINGQTISFTVAGITGTYNNVNATTNASGVATVTLTPHTWTKPGATATVTASANGGSATATTTPRVLGANALVVGWNNWYQLGVGDTAIRSSLTQPLRVFPSPIIQIVGGGLSGPWDPFWTLFLLEDGSVWSVGRNTSGQLGHGDTTDRTAPTKIAAFNGIPIKQIAAGDDTSYALTRDSGEVYAWGNGDGIDYSFTTRLSPYKISSLGTGVKSVAAGAGTGYAITSSDGVKAWGAGTMGRLGNGADNNSSTPVNVFGLGSGVLQIAAGCQTCYALLSTGEVRAWGLGDYGQLGNGTWATRNTPDTVSGLTAGSKVVEIASAYRTAYARTSEGVVYAWGANDSTEAGTSHYGMVGNNDTNNANTPKTVLATGASKLSASARNAYVQMNDGSFRSWSYNADGQLGNGATSAPTRVPVVANTTLAATGRTITALGGNSYGSLMSAYITDYISVP